MEKVINCLRSWRNNQGKKLNFDIFKTVLILILTTCLSQSFEFDPETSPWDYPLYKVENKLRFERF